MTVSHLEWRAVAIRLLAVAFFCVLSAKSVVGSEAGDTLFDSLAAIDNRLGLKATSIDSALDVLRSRLGSCGLDRKHSAEWTRCASAAMFAGAEGLHPAEEAGTLSANTLSVALHAGSGSCAALVAVALAVSEHAPTGFDAFVLRDHVLLSSRGKPRHYFEVMKEGQEILEEELTRYVEPPGGSRIVAPVDYVSYYLDNLAARLADAGRNEDAEWTFREALRRGPKVGRFHYNYGTFLLQHGRFPEALDQLREGIRRGWNDAGAWVNRGVAEWKVGDVRSAHRSFDKALRLDPANREAATNLAALNRTDSR